jgi:hypothetical protein
LLVVTWIELEQSFFFLRISRTALIQGSHNEHIFSTLCLVTSCYQLEISEGGKIYTTEIGKHSNMPSLPEQNTVPTLIYYCSLHLPNHSPSSQSHSISWLMLAHPVNEKPPFLSDPHQGPCPLCSNSSHIVKTVKRQLILVEIW